MAVVSMRILLGSGAPSAFIRIFVWLLLTESFGLFAQNDVDCLRAIKSSLEDPLGNLGSWDFSNNSRTSICKFTGIECWHEDDNKILNIRLPDMGLKGDFPQGIAGCKALTGLDLSRNSIRGSIPNDISKLIGFVTSLDLSSNQLSGEIPVNLGNCSFLNILRLDSNQLTGQIPLELGALSRLKTFSVANNRLSGQVPTFANASIPAENYANNPGLCGGPLPRCSGKSKANHTPIIIAAAVGGLTIAALGFVIGMFFLRRVSRKKKEDDPLGNKWARSIKGAKRFKLSMFENTVTKMNLGDLMKATNNFSNENIIGSRRTGTTYKATLEGGTSFMVKRLQDTQHSEKEFMSEMATLGNIKHRNLVPLLGFCVAKKERLLVYTYMPNGALHDKIHTGDDGKVMDWPLRLKVGIRAAKGFAWLHHSCNPRIIHRNISSKCILLDADYEPKISDFGLARLMNPVDTHLSTFVNGEFGDLGYVAPEYARTLVATPKGDVYSFGVVLLELVTGERPTHVAKAPESFKGSLVEWISELSDASKLHDAIDTSLVGKGHDSELFQFLKVACSCVLPGHKERPTMFEVYQLLRAIGQRYDFTTDDDLLMLQDPAAAAAADNVVELIVARDK
ncbi:probably inactive leucine-rich repeat receptor-like protein kinase At5g48380 [Salvia miltiorrhiza]|uniref:probably inactive leucine-rich repeat receptor-like protein kinase At5g48380 n=1 Tax=Salvia miltiorrhiza TaxID=226208 RepID=UPI0025AD3928|nr:probably inactive leucine-rich repeat receptor-like protein kinase At5g48380 [Salvia miltiorrhiza]XP_057782879.1 probably inactive leucine-rich repeat receptor-like protein kinase At5g48380 [Salvia miltiorrhiza]XP_057782880.1 probably inactive leucine-rich repeat receptor-like protein kinase At5g48380 [Salvia miltiorrhiza]XP_057782881.1 probably inactive leucine-rich repeat receptor-like protein kinase At5g48380 [Salvia miltiorrhiza]XP_057782882.1 probably inactive leucine-rich repeat recept